VLSDTTARARCLFFSISVSMLIYAERPVSFRRRPEPKHHSAPGCLVTNPKSETRPLVKSKRRLKAQRHQASMMLGGAARRAGSLNGPARIDTPGWRPGCALRQRVAPSAFIGLSQAGHDGLIAATSSHGQKRKTPPERNMIAWRCWVVRGRVFKSRQAGVCKDNARAR
jgi:hypothetical protein